MRLFRRARPVYIDVVDGFWAAEAVAMQRVIASGLRSAGTATGAVPAELELGHGVEERVVVHWQGLIVGFVPPARAAELHQQISAAAPAPVVVEGRVIQHEGIWRIWVGPPWPTDGEPPQLPADELGPPPEGLLDKFFRG